MKAMRWLLVLCAVLLVACGGKTEDAKTPGKDASMDDALALLPGSAILLGTVDARAFFGSQTFGADLAKLVEKYVPLGDEAGFKASRDVDRVTFASYSYQGVDVAAIVVGKFDQAKIKAAAANHTTLKSGGQLVASQYTGRDVYTVNNIGFTLLSDTRAVAGTEAGIRRVLDRIKDNRVKRDITPWMITTIETQGAAAAVAADFQSQPIPEQVRQQIGLPFIQSLKAARAVATFQPPGLQIAGALTFPDAATATTSSESIKKLMNMAGWLAIVGVKIQSQSVKVEQSDVQVSISTDDASLRQLLTAVPQMLGGQ